MFFKGLNIFEIDRVFFDDFSHHSQSEQKKVNYRTKQVLKWVYSKYEDNPELFTDLSKPLRSELNKKFNFRSLDLVDYQFSKISNSIKFAFKTLDNEIVESVLMKHPGRYTLCVSSQVGCNVGCIFCASGMFGLKRNLETHEIVEQLFQIQKFIFEREGKRISNIVFMGMGEPLVNYRNVLKSIEIFTSDWGFNISKRNITLSTSGILPRIYDLVVDGVRVKLALSLHSPFQHEREKLIPIAKKYTIDQILKAVEYYYLNTKRRITIEYILIKDVNDSVNHAKELVNLFKNYNMKVWVNLIPYNSIGNIYFEDKLLEEPKIERIREFENIIKDYFEVSVRWSLGRDIDGACGQLRRRIISN
ncbi:MAG: 23S rRNA (adenine(2503)-C(2))-methyltransferase RlmN [Candidatus Calescibacterium sp.]|nr:23S rRNA (adenine(2503)-C(2))-methyltransferase RlmN [Candidatus Calescibacterium sp.]MDW8132816.1 23S rRNA (adenine(2503)-C(2))-methyltransferase RlmN [Candidatus Calescibacterium sp.]